MGEMKKFNRTNNFGQIYEMICAQKSVSPLPTIQAHLTENRLRFCCDRVNHEDWSPILNALAADRSLVEIHAYSRYRRKKISESIDTEEKLDEYRCFVDAVAVCARDSMILTSLCLDGIPLGRRKYLEVLCTGLSFNRNLQNISLARCRIGDEGCNLLLRAFLENPKLQLIDLTSCLLTSKSAHFITSFLKKRRTKLLENVWHEYTSHKDAKQFQGLHTLLLNKNRKFGDDGFRTLTDTLKDDFWLKSLSLRGCGLTRISGEAIIDLLETNSILITMNFKGNELPIEIVKTTRKLLKRRLEKGERISLRRRLINRKKDLHWKKKNRSVGKTGIDHGQMNSKRIIVRSRMSNVLRLKNSDTKLTELTKRLSNLIDCNRKLKRGLSNDRRLLVGEKRARMSAEKSYELMTPVVEKLRHGFRKQNRVNSRVLLESHLCTDIRKIFNDLENMSAINARIIDGERGVKRRGNEDLKIIVDKFSISRFGRKRKFFGHLQKRPSCPRQKV